MSYYDGQQQAPPLPPRNSWQPEGGHALYPPVASIPPPPPGPPPGNHGLGVPDTLTPPPIPPRPPGWRSQPKPAGWNETTAPVAAPNPYSYEPGPTPGFYGRPQGYQAPQVEQMVQPNTVPSYNAPGYAPAPPLRDDTARTGGARSIENLSQPRPRMANPTSQCPPQSSSNPQLDSLQTSLHSMHLGSPPPSTSNSHPASAYPSYLSQHGEPVASRAAPVTQTLKRILYSSSTPNSVIACIDTPTTFTTDWYWHSQAPDYLICSKCYVDHIFPSQFKNDFQCQTFSDGKARICRFSKPRMKDNLFKAAVRTRSLRAAVDWMNLRASLPECKREAAVKGDAGLKWYRTRNNEVPDMVFCEACYEDYLEDFARGKMERTEPQPLNKKWSCDMAIPFIRREYEQDAKKNNWANFVAEAKSRMLMPACPQNQSVRSRGRAWFTPVNGPSELVFCGACYCDQVLYSGNEKDWRRLPDTPRGQDKNITCVMGNFVIKMAIAVAQDAKDWSIFWKAINKLSKTEQCDPAGITKGDCYTFRSDPYQFGICETCYVGILEPLNITRFFVGKQRLASEGKLICALNTSNARFGQYVSKMLETYFLQNPGSFDKLASVYASIPPCARDNEMEGRQWYGWNECTICVECFHDFARHSPLASLMTLQKVTINDKAICDLYSPRMRGLYTQCAAESPPNPQSLLDFSAHRGQVYAATVPVIKSIIAQQRAALSQQQMMNTMSTFYTQSGYMQEIAYGTPYTSYVPGLGGGFHTLDGIRGAQYGAAANSIMMQANDPSRLQMVKDLEKQWRAVE